MRKARIRRWLPALLCGSLLTLGNAATATATTSSAPPPAAARLDHQRGGEALAHGHYTAAGSYYQEALRQAMASPRPDSSFVGTVFFDLGQLRQRYADQPGAAHYYRQALQWFPHHAPHRPQAQAALQAAASLSPLALADVLPSPEWPHWLETLVAGATLLGGAWVLGQRRSPSSR